jgi:hypothetical protein
VEEEAEDIKENGLNLQNENAVIDIEALLFGVNIVLLPMASDSLLQDLEKGVMENLIVNVIMEALCNEIPVKVLGSGRESLKGKSEGVIAYKNKRRQIFQSFGIDIIDWNDDEIEMKATSIPTFSEGIITEDDIYEYAKENNKEIHLRNGYRITPLARDTARDLGIKFIEV